MELLSRNSFSNCKAKAIRKKGFVPGILYGKNMDSIKVAMDKKEFKQMYIQNKENKAFDIEFNNQTHKVYIHEVQRDVMNDKEFIHFDLHKLTAEDFIHTHIPIVLENKSKIESQGYIVQQQLLDIEVKYEAYNTNTYVSGDLSYLQDGGSLTVSDLNIPQGISVLADMNSIVASVNYPKTYQTFDSETDIDRDLTKKMENMK
ncbi:MAG: 50S ribosomal protein L25 [Tepidibacter sp.]|jgi:large subunit ribosomal protein L25|uniref:50S ribosomal protein L25 n=1 Tax=Tepidibacter sp. TaxID=2529387 RepID=UPI0025FA2914|nr:50S ribosomal protein L25 [Tepidibacter sp.]MCT4509146.1 50S ribosomal protein L25 [Tepidibacter sp.]